MSAPVTDATKLYIESISHSLTDLSAITSKTFQNQNIIEDFVNSIINQQQQQQHQHQHQHQQQHQHNVSPFDEKRFTAAINDIVTNMTNQTIQIDSNGAHITNFASNLTSNFRK